MEQTSRKLYIASLMVTMVLLALLLLGVLLPCWCTQIWVIVNEARMVQTQTIARIYLL
jgi:hypothetical protein